MHEPSLTVVKIGGSAGVDPGNLCADVAGWARQGRSTLLVHGVSGRVNRLSEALGRPPTFLTSPAGFVSRYTDLPTRRIYVRAAKEENAQIVSALAQHGVEAVGMDGVGYALSGLRKQATRAVVAGHTVVIRDDYSGRISDIDEVLLRSILAAGRVPVLPPLVHSKNDGHLNVDGDRVAAAVAAALGARTLIILSDIPGLMRRYPEEDSLVRRVGRDEMEQAFVWAQGRMKRKVLSAREAIEGGVERVGLADARVRQPLRQAMAGGGTWFDG